MARPDLHGVHVFLRACGERTLDAALAVLREQIDADRIGLISERPFSAAVVRTFERAAEAFTRSKARWIVAMDADVLLKRDALAAMVELCEASPAEAFKINGVVLCRVHGGYCFRGVHAYRADLMPQAAEIAGGQALSLRPETAVGVEMERRGHGFAVHPRVVGVHDFEQSLRHLYLKMLLRARKSEDRAWLRERLVRMAELPESAGGGDDFLVSLWGFDDALGAAGGADGPAEYDWLAEYPRLDERMRAHGLREKPPMPASLGVGYAESAIAGYRADDDAYTPAWIRKAMGLSGAPERLRACNV